MQCNDEHTCVLAGGAGPTLRVAGDAPVPGVGQGVVVLVHHCQPRAPLEVLCRQTVL